MRKLIILLVTSFAFFFLNTPLEAFNNALKGVEKLSIVELNHQGQLAQYLRTELDLPKDVYQINRSGGAVWQPAEIVVRLKETMYA